MKVLYIGCVKSSLILLKELLKQKKDICGVITKTESKINSDFEDLTPLCDKYNIKVHYTDNANDKTTIDFIKSLSPDIIYCFGWSHLLVSEIINLPRLGVVGFHPAKLPNNKGRHPLIWALVLGLKETASTFFMIDKKADNGVIISQEDVRINDKDDVSILYKRIMRVAKRQVIEITDNFENNSIKFIEQNENGNVWRKRTRSDGKIDFRMSGKNIFNLVRGLSKPYTGAHFEFNDKEYKVWKCEVVKDNNKEYENIEFGKILKIYSSTCFLVKTGENLIKVLNCDENELQEGDYL